jgi:hypothetical protein
VKADNVNKIGTDTYVVLDIDENYYQDPQNQL